MARISKVRQFQSALNSVAFIAGTCVITTMAAANNLEAQTRGQASRASSEEAVGFTLNTNLSEPRLTGRPAVAADVNLTLNALTWLDASGSPTVAPGRGKMIAIISQGRLGVSGSTQDRLGAVRKGWERQAMGEPVRFFGTPGEGLGEVRALLDARLGGLKQYGQNNGPQEVLNNAGRQLEDLSNVRRTSNQEENERVIEEVRNLPEKVVRGAVEDATREAEWALRNRIGKERDKILGKIR